MKTKLNKKDYIYLGIIILSFIILILAITGGTYLYGSSLDWYAQHLAIPEYFRTLFYDTFDLFPDFAANIGAGENIYNLSYYGLLSPHILLSYLLPMIPMNIYIPLITIISVIASGILMYLFLKKKNMSSETCFLASLMLVLSAPMTFHSHRHIMFINYMPFLIMGLFGVDKKFDEQKGWLLTLGTFLMIMTSYYYSIGGIGTIFLYALYRYLQKMNKVTLKSFFKTFFSILSPILVAILASSIITLPTLASIVFNRAPSNVTINFKELLIPHMNTKAILYHPYGIGLNAIVLISIINLFKKNKANITLATILTILFTFKIFPYVLNGTMYAQPKSLIPLLPIYIIAIAILIEDIINKEVNYKIIIPIMLIISIFIFHNEYGVNRYIIDIIVLTIAFISYAIWKNKYALIIPIALFTLINSIGLNFNDHLVLKYTAEEQEKNVKENLELITSNDDTFYRISNDLNKVEFPNRIFDNINYYTQTIYSSVSNQTYNKFYYDDLYNNISTRNRALTITQPNLLGLMLNNNKYIITRAEALHGYNLISSNNGINIYKNENVLPIAFATSNLMSYEDYNKLPEEIRQEALLNVIVADTKTNNKFVPHTEFIELNTDKIFDNEAITKEDNGTYTIKVKDKLQIKYKLPKKYRNKILMITFDMNKKSSKEDLSIQINNVKNKLTESDWVYYNGNETFNYVLADQNQNELIFTFTEGTYNIGDFRTYMLDYAYIENASSQVSPLIVNKDKTKGDKLNGEINVYEDGYFMLTVPYDKGFTVKVDDKEVNYEKVDNAYIGFKIKEGKHKIEIKYNAPLKNISLLISSFGFIIYSVIITLESKIKF